MGGAFRERRGSALTGARASRTARLNAHPKPATAVTHSTPPFSTSKREKSSGLMGIFSEGRETGDAKRIERQDAKMTNELPKRVRLIPSAAEV